MAIHPQATLEQEMGLIKAARKREVTIKDAWDSYKDYTEISSTNSRKLAFTAGVICWVFRSPDNTFPEEILFAIIFIVGFFIADLLQYIAASIILFFWTRNQERNKHVNDIPIEDVEISLSPTLDVFPRSLFYIKIALLFMAYIYIMRHVLGIHYSGSCIAFFLAAPTNFLSLLPKFALWLVGTALSIVIALWYERRGDPRLSLSIGTPKTNDEKEWRFLIVSVKNAAKSNYPLVDPKTAYACHGYIEFFSCDGVRLSENSQPMPIRWEANPEPLKPEVDNGHRIMLPDRCFLRSNKYINIPPGEIENINVVVKFGNTPKIYGWTDESYFFSEMKHTKYEFSHEEFLVRISISAANSSTAKETFRIKNYRNYRCVELSEC